MSADADAKNWKDVVEIYEKGKERRYTLLFSVNGGALAIAKLITGAEGHMVVVGGLHLWMLAYAMMVFSLFMAFDIYKFGERMQKYDRDLFRWPGKLVLFVLGAMLITVWALVSTP